MPEGSCSKCQHPYHLHSAVARTGSTGGWQTIVAVCMVCLTDEKARPGSSEKYTGCGSLAPL